MRICASSGIQLAVEPQARRGSDMVFDELRFGRLEDRLHRANALTPDLVSEVISAACPRLVCLGANAREGIVRLTQTGAYVDATLTLIELELPQWKLRRLEHEEGNWYCVLSKQPWVPLGFDEKVEAIHQILPLAILIALVQARHFSLLSAMGSSILQVKPATIYAVSCDNYS
jgi:hypothetical protein